MPQDAWTESAFVRRKEEGVRPRAHSLSRSGEEMVYPTVKGTMSARSPLMERTTA